jgi:predicted enzyme related to lactoylglutathione lyase
VTTDPIPCWIDLGVEDPERAAAFYGELLGWDVAAPVGEGYRLASRKGHLVAAFGPADDPGVPYWTVYLRTDDAAATVAAIQAAGGTVVTPPEPVGDGGIAAIVRDPNCATFALWQPLGLTGSWAAPESGTLAGVQLRIADLTSARRFWNAATEWRLDDDGAIRHGDRLIGTWCAGAEGDDTSPWLIQLRTDDLAAALQRAASLGATIEDSERGILRDPAGARFSLVALRLDHARLRLGTR